MKRGVVNGSNRAPTAGVGSCSHPASWHAGGEASMGRMSWHQQLYQAPPPRSTLHKHYRTDSSTVPLPHHPPAPAARRRRRFGAGSAPAARPPPPASPGRHAPWPAARPAAQSTAQPRPFPARNVPGGTIDAGCEGSCWCSHGRIRTSCKLPHLQQLLAHGPQGSALPVQRQPQLLQPAFHKHTHALHLPDERVGKGAGWDGGGGGAVRVLRQPLQQRAPVGSACSSISLQLCKQSVISYVGVLILADSLQQGVGKGALHSGQSPVSSRRGSLGARRS
jgi:hypothetical protein